MAPASRRASVWVRPRPRPAPDTQMTLSARENSGRRCLVPTVFSPVGRLGTIVGMSVVSMATDIVAVKIDILQL